MEASSITRSVSARASPKPVGSTKMRRCPRLIGPASAQRADLEQILRNLNYVTRSLRGFAEQLGQRRKQALADFVKVAITVGIQHKDAAVAIEGGGDGQRQHMVNAVVACRLAPGAKQGELRHRERACRLALQRSEGRADAGEQVALDAQRLGIGGRRACVHLRADGVCVGGAEPGPGQADVTGDIHDGLAHPADDLQLAAPQDQLGRALEQHLGNHRALALCVKARGCGGLWYGGGRRRLLEKHGNDSGQAPAS